MSYTSKVNGLDIPISGDMARAARFFKTEHSAQIIDDGQAQVNVNDPSQLKSEIARLQRQIAGLEEKAKPAKVAKPRAPAESKTSEDESDLA